MRGMLRRRERLRVQFQRQPATRMPHQFLSGFEIHTVALQERCERPTEGMPSDLLPGCPAAWRRAARSNALAFPASMVACHSWYG